ncbi:MAG TPA: glycosyltransferase family 4 protein [Gemmatimonadota bacterium]|nr:glycosyltransferase family 4 protein [Gemmatimonadota bacterium]
MSERREGGMGRTRIAYVVDNLSFRGGERTFLQLASGLPRSRYEVAVACSPGGVFVDRLHDLGVPVIAAEMRQRRRMDTVLSLARELRRRRPHIVHTQGRGDPFGRLAARLARVPVVVSTTAMISSRYEVEEVWRKALYRLIDWTTDRLVDQFIVVDRGSVDALTRRHRIRPSRVAVIPNGIEIERFDPSRVHRGAWRAKLGIPSGAVLIGGIGRLTWQKGFTDLIKALAALDDTNSYLVIAGDGPDWGDLRTLANGLDVARRVIFAGFVEDVPGLMADLDLFVLSSLREGHPMVLLEAMATGIPVIATDIAGVGDTVVDGVDGRLVPPGDVPTLVEAMRAVLRDRESAARMGRNGRKKVQQEYTVERMVRRTAVLYEELLAQKGLAV